MQIGERPAGGYTVTLPTFEGPLDLLLHLCQKHELDVLDIPIAFVTEKYLEYLAVMQLIELDVASEYLVMAATLAHIKSKMLLPAPPPGQEDDVAGEEEDPREALIRRLLEYQKYKQAGEELQSRGVAGRDVFLRGTPIEEAIHTGLPPLAQVPLFSLVEAFQNVLEKSKVHLTHDIVHERVTLADRINELVDILRVKKRVAFEDLFEGQTTKFDLVITFLALLEMTRLRMTRLFQESFDAQIWVEFSAQVAADETLEENEENAEEESAPDTPLVAPPVDADPPPDIDAGLAALNGVEARAEPEPEPALEGLPRDTPSRPAETGPLTSPDEPPPSDRSGQLDELLSSTDVSALDDEDSPFDDRDMTTDDEPPPSQDVPSLDDEGDP
ncbi:MAG: segregation/condensation protein A [Labilithrix sp.]|nr:segregation/condensation protein A [Labilithrix sp.]MCW5811910.1 segregation/condensation protein A [Labilithrix sp.]